MKSTINRIELETLVRPEPAPPFLARSTNFKTVKEPIFLVVADRIAVVVADPNLDWPLGKIETSSLAYWRKYPLPPEVAITLSNDRNN